jgi:hypothetical protein
LNKFFVAYKYPLLSLTKDLENFRIYQFPNLILHTQDGVSLMDFDIEYVLEHATNAQKIALVSGELQRGSSSHLQPF